MNMCGFIVLIGIEISMRFAMDNEVYIIFIGTESVMNEMVKTFMPETWFRASA